jgi:phage baseplate assembly protein W
MELYIKTVGDPNFNGTEVQTKDEVKQLLTQIETILFTNKGEVLGDIDFGCSLNDLIYELNANEYTLKNEIETQIDKYCPLSTKYDVKTDIVFVRGEIRDEAYIDITVDNTFVLSVSP